MDQAARQTETETAESTGVGAGLINRASKNFAMVLCIAGMGLFLAWTVGNAYTKQVAGFSAGSPMHAVDVAGGVGCNIAVLLAVALLARRIGSLVTRRWVCVLGGALGIVGPAAVVAVFSLMGDTPLMAVGSALKGAASALLFLLWNEVFCRLSIREVSICYAGSYLLSVILQALMGALPEAAAFVCVLLCSVGSAALLGPASHILPCSGEALVEGRQWTFPWRPLLMAAAYTFVAFLLRQLLSDSSDSFSWVGGGIVALVCLVGCLLFFERRFDASVFEFAAMPLIVAGLLLFCWQGEDARELILFLTDAGNVAFRIFLMVVLCNICFRYGVPPLWLFAIVRIAMMAAEGCGLGLSIWASCSGLTASTQVTLPLCYAMVLALVLVSTPALRMRRLVETSWYIVPKVAGEMSRADQLQAVMGGRELTLWKASQAARLHGLTHREEEVLVCLAEGMNRAQIQEQLVLSESTVRTHLRHLYAKLDVHSKEEAVALVESMGN